MKLQLLLLKIYFNKHSQSIVNRLGNHTVSTGTLKIKLQVVRQLRCSLQLQSGGMPTVDEVILAYRKTKSRLEKTS